MHRQVRLEVEDIQLRVRIFQANSSISALIKFYSSQIKMASTKISPYSKRESQPYVDLLDLLRSKAQ